MLSFCTIEVYSFPQNSCMVTSDQLNVRIQKLARIPTPSIFE